MSKYLAKSASVLVGTQTAHGTPVTLVGTNVLAVTDLTKADEFTSQEFTFAGKPTRDTETYIQDKTSNLSFSTYFPAYGSVAPALYSALEAAGAATIVGGTTLVKATNSLDSCDEATLQFLMHQECSLGDDKSQVMQDAGATVDFEVELDNRGMFKFNWLGEYSLPSATTPLTFDFGEQKTFIAPTMTKANLITAKLQPTGSVDVGAINVCIGKLTVTNLFGKKLERYRLSCDEGHVRSDEAGEVSLTILEDDVTADYSPETMLEALHSLTLEWGTLYKQGVSFDKLQLVEFSKTELGVWSGYELKFKNRGDSEVYNIPTNLTITDLTELNAYELTPYSVTYTLSGGTDPSAPAWAVANAPAWLTMDGGTGILSGTPPLGSSVVTSGIVVSVIRGVESATLAPFDLTTQVGALPIAVDDAPADVSLNSVSLFTVLTNDSGGQGTATLENIVGVTGGGTAVVSGSQIEFTAPTTPTTSVITYRMSDGAGNFSDANVTVNVVDNRISAVGWRVVMAGLSSEELQNIHFLDDSGDVSLMSEGGIGYITTGTTAVFDAAPYYILASNYTAARKLPLSKIVTSYTITFEGASSSVPSTVLQYSHNTTDAVNGDWVTIDSQGALSYAGTETKTFTGFNV